MGARKRSPRQFWLRHLATVLQVPLTVLEEGGRVDRRTFITDVAAGAVAPIVASDLIGHGFSAALRARPSGEVWQGKLADYGRDYMTAGAAEVQRRLAADLVVLQQQLDTPVMWDGAVRQDLPWERRGEGGALVPDGRRGCRPWR
jgi:hypothetical protein